MAPGSLLTVEPATNLSNFSVPTGLSMSRIIYTTTNLNGTTIPASAYILWPYSPLQLSSCPNQGYPMVAWAHGTSGALKACAPSNYRNLQYHFMAPFALALQGIGGSGPRLRRPRHLFPPVGAADTPPLDSGTGTRQRPGQRGSRQRARPFRTCSGQTARSWPWDTRRAAVRRGPLRSGR